VIFENIMILVQLSIAKAGEEKIIGNDLNSA